MKYELQNLIQGKGGTGKGDLIQQIAAHLRTGKGAGTGNEKEEYTKQQEEKSLIAYIDEKALWYTGIISEYTQIGEGAEQKVYYDARKGTVIKTNDSIFYKYWEDYFHSLIIHNYLFSDTAYKFLGFRVVDENLFAVVEQSHIIKTEDVDLNDVQDFLETNGFRNTRRNDYYNDDLGIILEDLHDENVISSSNMLFFVDTVFYLTDKFYE